MQNILQTILGKIATFISSITIAVGIINSPQPVITNPTPSPTPIQITITPTISPFLNKKLNSNLSPSLGISPSISPIAIPTPDHKSGPGGIAPGAYSPDSLTQAQKQWLWKFYGHEGNAPSGYGGETFVPTRTYSGSSKACFTFYGESVSGDTYTKGKPITFDASCSENAKMYLWYLFDQRINDEGDFWQKTITKCYGCSQPSANHGTSEWKIKLQVQSEKVDYKPDSIEKILKVKS